MFFIQNSKPPVHVIYFFKKPPVVYLMYFQEPSHEHSLITTSPVTKKCTLKNVNIISTFYRGLSSLLQINKFISVLCTFKSFFIPVYFFIKVFNFDRICEGCRRLVSFTQTPAHNIHMIHHVDQLDIWRYKSQN